LNTGSALIFDVRRYSLHDGPGIRTSVFLKGCPLACPWCHNPEGVSFVPELQYRQERCIQCGACIKECGSGAITGGGCVSCGACAEVCPSGARELVGKSYSVEDILKLSKADEQFYDESEGGVTFTGGEPLSQGVFVLEAAQALQNCGIHVAIDTSGYTSSDSLSRIAEHTNLFLYDIKHMNDEIHHQITGVSNKIIHANIKALAALGSNIVISIPLIPGFNNDECNLQDTARFIQSLKPSGRSHPYPVRILPYHDSARAKYTRKNLPYPCNSLEVPSTRELERAASIFRNQGITTAIGGL